MATTKQTFISSMESLVHGENLLLDAIDQGKAVDMATKEHSRHKPKIRVVDETGTDAFEIKCVTAMTYWKEGFSSILSVEYPIDDDDETPDMLEDDSLIKSYQKDDGEYFRFLEDTPGTDEEFRLKYTAPHVVDDSGSTIDYNDENAFEFLTAAYFCNMLAAAYIQNNNSMISADSVNHTNQASEYRKQAKEYFKLYYDHIGVEPGKVAAACAIDDQDLEGSWGSDRLSHPWRSKNR